MSAHVSCGGNTTKDSDYKDCYRVALQRLRKGAAGTKLVGRWDGYRSADFFSRSVRMLVLTRREGQRIRIGQDCYLEVIRITPNTVPIGFAAPDGVVIVREELLDEEEACQG